MSQSKKASEAADKLAKCPRQHTDEVRRQLQQISEKQDDMENHLRRCNLRFMALPETAKD